MRIASFACFTLLSFASLTAHAADATDLQAKCQEQLAANQDGLAKAKQLAQLAGHEQASQTLASADSGCERLGAEADNGLQSAGQGKLSQATSEVNAATDTLKSLGSMFGN